jgi:hypothetical protein
MAREEGMEELVTGATDYQRFTDASSNIQNHTPRPTLLSQDNQRVMGLGECSNV